MNKAKIAILSSVKPWIFAWLAQDERFTSEERQKALMDEADVWKSTIELDYVKQNTVFEVVNVLEWLPAKWSYDGYILWGSPSMVTERAPWMLDLEKFIHEEINAGKSTIWFCFWHQILASAFGGKVENAPSRKIGKWSVLLNTEGQGDKLFSQMDKNFESIWSHKQYVSNPGEAKVLGNNEHTPNQIIRLWENAWGCQFHSEFSQEFTSFLVKLMKESISGEWQNPDQILQELAQMQGNESSKIITFFIQNILKS